MASETKQVPPMSATLTGGGDASAANQTTGNTALSNILTKLADPATQTTLAAVLAKIIAAPATEAKQDTQITKLAGGLPAALGAGGGLKIEGSGTALPVTDPDIAPANCWAVGHGPAANTKATIEQAAPGAGKRLVCTRINVMLVAGATAPSAIQVNASLIEDKGGAGEVVKWPIALALQAVAGDRAGLVSPCYIPATNTNKKFTLEFADAGGANTVESVAMEGITLSV